MDENRCCRGEVLICVKEITVAAWKILKTFWGALLSSSLIQMDGYLSRSSKVWCRPTNSSFEIQSTQLLDVG